MTRKVSPFLATALAAALTLGAISPALAKEPLPLDDLVLKPEFFSLEKAAFAETMGDYGFRWVSEAQDTARAAVPGMKLADLPVVEALIRFNPEGKAAGAGISIYTKGDSKEELNKEGFGQLVKEAQDKLTVKLGGEPELLKSDNTSPVPSTSVRWTSDSAVAVLEWSFTREVKTRDIPFRAEFVRLTYTPPAEKKNILEERLAKIDSRKPAQVERKPVTEENGDIWLTDVPMVDQGQKGYCVVAASERVLRYYGKEVNQHELAQLADSSAAQGTSSDAMVAALKSLTAKFKIKVRTHQDLEVRSFMAMVKDYNRQAKRADKAEIQLSKQMISVDEVYGQMDPEVLREAKVSSRSDYTRWKSAVTRHIGEGVPVLWTVMVGLYPEEKLGQGRGGHMRLIIGYNEKEEKIIYSDTWGQGHERKILPMDHAYAMTTGLYTIEPL